MKRRPIPPTHHLKTAIRKIDKIVWKLHDEQLAAYIAGSLNEVRFFKRGKREKVLVPTGGLTYPWMRKEPRRHGRGGGHRSPDA
jgi:hypothetical protein